MVVLEGLHIDVSQEIIHLINPPVVSCNACWFQVLINLDISEDVLCNHVVLPELGIEEAYGLRNWDLLSKDWPIRLNSTRSAAIR